MQPLLQRLISDESPDFQQVDISPGPSDPPSLSELSLAALLQHNISMDPLSSYIWTSSHVMPPLLRCYFVYRYIYCIAVEGLGIGQAEWLIYGLYLTHSPFMNFLTFSTPLPILPVYMSLLATLHW